MLEDSYTERKKWVGATGFEPATSYSQSSQVCNQCSNPPAIAENGALHGRKHRRTVALLLHRTHHKTERHQH